MARTSSPNFLSCRNPYQTPHSPNPSPFSLETPFLSMKSALSDPLPKNRLLSLYGMGKRPKAGNGKKQTKTKTKRGKWQKNGLKMEKKWRKLPQISMLCHFFAPCPAGGSFPFSFPFFPHFRLLAVFHATPARQEP